MLCTRLMGFPEVGKKATRSVQDCQGYCKEEAGLGADSYGPGEVVKYYFFFQSLALHYLSLAQVSSTLRGSPQLQTMDYSLCGARKRAPCSRSTSYCKT
jgi:hypothetical protein